MSVKLDSIPRLSYEDVDAYIDEKFSFYTTEYKTEDGEELIRYHALLRGGSVRGNYARWMVQPLPDGDDYKVSFDENGYMEWNGHSSDCFKYRAKPMTDDEIDRGLRIGEYLGLDNRITV